MECEVSPENGPGCSTTGKEVSGLQKFKYEHEHVGGLDVRLGFPVTVLGKISDQQMYLSVAPLDRAAYQTADSNVPTDIPFMNNMDEISYWIYTKRAPCLMNYDNLIKKHNEEAHTSKSKPKSVPNTVQEVPSPKKKKKRKLISLCDGSVNDNNQKNIYFENSQKQNDKIVMSSDDLGSDIDFNIKNSSIQAKPKRPKLQKHSKTILHKKNKLITSTPKVPHTSLRRSLRQKLRSMNNGHNKISLTFNSSIVNGNNLKNSITLENNSSHKLIEPSEILAAGDQSYDKQNTTNVNLKNDILNRQFEDLSDLSGFTANYIRSTKVQSKKSPRKLKCKTSKNLIKESRQNEEKVNTTLVCINKSMNTKLTKNPLLNCSTDSSQNIINLVSTKDNDKSPKLDKSTSILKFLDKTKHRECLNVSNQKNKNNLNITFQPTTSRYPRRSKNSKANNIQPDVNSKNVTMNSSDFDNSDRKENPEEKLASRTRSGRSIGLKLRHHENSVLVLSDSSGHVSSTASMNLASSNGKLKKKKRLSNRAVRNQKSGKAIQRDSVRDKSGFTACFSDSDEDSEPLQRKFFCT